MDPRINIGIITPTYHRPQLLKPFIRRVRSQSYPFWNLSIIHDGEDETTRSVVAKYAARDPRVQYLETSCRANDYGVTPRLLGISTAFGGRACDYLVFWDDDNLLYSRALRDIARSLASANFPDLLLVPMYHSQTILPPAGAAISSLGKTQVDTANLVVRFDVASQYYRTVAERCKSEANPYTQDFLFFETIRDAVPPQNIAVARCKPIGLYDGLLLEAKLSFIRTSLRLPPMYLNRFSWYRTFVSSKLNRR